MRYGDFEDLKKQLISHRVVKWTPDKLVLENGTVLSIEESESDCCAWAGGEFKDVKLDAAITNVEVSEVAEDSFDEYDDEVCNSVKVTLFHNLNPVAVVNCSADNGNGGYYYSVCSLVIKGIHYPVVEA